MTERPVVVVQLPEKLSADQSYLFLREVEPCLSVHRPCIVLDCARVRQIDSGGIQLLLRCLEEAMKRNGDVKLARISPRVAAVLELVKIDQLFEVFDSTANAVNSFHEFPLYAFQESVRPRQSSSASEGIA